MKKILLLLLPLLLVTCFCLAQDAKEIIGKPITIGNLLVAQNDFPNQMKWVDAVNECTTLGKGWRLPTKDELNELYKNKDKIGNFSNSHYWSNTVMVCFNFWHTILIPVPSSLNDKETKYNVRALRSF